MSSKETAKQKIQELINRFESEKKHYLSLTSDDQEREIEEHLITPFFEALGWNQQSIDTPLYDRDMRLQYAVDLKRGVKRGETRNKKVDYAFRLNHQDMFYVEVKVPKRQLRPQNNRPTQDTIESIWQAKTYGWGKVPLVILTDFEEFRVFNTIAKPDIYKYWDQIVPELDLYYTNNQQGIGNYLDNFDSLWDTFSRDAVISGSLRKYESGIQSVKKQSIDDALLETVNSWRKKLAQNISYNLKKDNKPQLSSMELTEAVQTIIDRLLFIRFLEDNDIEPDIYLKRFYDKQDDYYEESEDIYSSIVAEMVKLSNDYNGSIFGKRDETQRHFSEQLKISNSSIKYILKDLYDNSPYDFSQIPIEVLGTMYEKFLGDVIIVKTPGQTDIETKPEVRSAGGVYYTPEFIVNYIVENTVGNKIKGKNPSQISKIKILDPACGSGSFLIGATKRIFDEYERYFSDQVNSGRTTGVNEKFQILESIEEEIQNGKIVTKEEKRVVLTTEFKKEIILNNIHGVDIDSQAVDVTKMSLCLLILEKGFDRKGQRELAGLKEAILPKLDNNIKCGNSLVASDFFEKQEELFSENLLSTKPFNWELEYKAIFDNGGFDCVIGNPPYLRIQGLQDNYAPLIEYFILKYQSATKRFDFYLLFMEKGFKLLNNEGLLGFITPHKFLNSDFGIGLRSFLLENSALDKVISFGNNLIFSQASTYTGLFFLSKRRKDSFKYTEIEPCNYENISYKLNNFKTKDFSDYIFSDLDQNPWILTSSSSGDIITKINQKGIPAKEIFNDIMVGIQSGLDSISILQIESVENDIYTCFSEIEGKSIQLEKGILQEVLMGDDVKKYTKRKPSYVVIYPYEFIDGKTQIISETKLKNDYPLAYSYLQNNKKILKEKRISMKTNPIYWYSCHRQRKIEKFESNKILTPEISLGCNMTLDLDKSYHNTQIYSLIPNPNFEEDIKFWLGIMNSNLFWWYLKNTGTVLRGGYFRFKTKYIEPFPLPTINFSDLDQKNIHDQLVKSVAQRIDLEDRLGKSIRQADKDLFISQIKNIESKINGIVYKLYDLTDNEIEEIEKEAV